MQRCGQYGSREFLNRIALGLLPNFVDSARRRRLEAEIIFADSVVDDIIGTSDLLLNTVGVGKKFQRVAVLLQKSRDFLHCLEDIDCALLEGTLDKQFYTGTLLHRNIEL